MSTITSCFRTSMVGIIGAAISLIAYDQTVQHENVGEIDEPRFPAPSIYQFSQTDNELCRKNFRDLEQWYADGYPSAIENEEENNELYTKLLQAMADGRVELVDNERFFEFVKNQPNQSTRNFSLRETDGKEPAFPKNI